MDEHPVPVCDVGFVIGVEHCLALVLIPGDLDYSLRPLFSSFGPYDAVLSRR